MPYSTLLTDIKDGIITITINRPDKLNALNKDVFTDLDNAIDDMLTNPDIKAAVITGTGQKAFVAGADITEFDSLTKTGAITFAKRGQAVFFKIENSAKPVIAAVNGFALGGGCELAMACHFRIASENAKFGQPEVNLGLLPGYGGTQRLAQLIGKGRALELLISGGMVDAATALGFGLVNYVVPLKDLLPKSYVLLATIGTKAPLAVAACITAVNALYDGTKNGYNTEANLFGECFNTSDRKEGAAAFLEKRKPSFKGK